MKKLLLLLALVGMVAVGCNDDDFGGEEMDKNNPLSKLTCAPNEILYATKYGVIIDLAVQDGFGSKLFYNVYENGVGHLIFDNDVTIIPPSAFEGQNTITYMKLPDKITNIGTNAFKGCILLKNIKLPNSVTAIGDYAFYGCSSLTSITIPDSVTSIGDYAFYGCSSLSVNVLISDLATYCKTNRMIDVSVSKRLLLNGVEITELTVPNSITYIGAYAFCNINNLTSVTIPDTITEIGYFAFKNCSNLSRVYCKATTPPMGNLDMFFFNASNRKIYVPRNSVSAYKSAQYWRDYADDIVGYDF